MNLLLFSLATTFLFVHELDAIRAREWKLFIVLKDLDEKTAYTIWLFLHIPLFLIPILVISDFIPNLYSTRIRLFLDLFFIVHLLIHIQFRKKPEYRFNSLVSVIFIVLAALFGFLDLAYFITQKI